MPHDHKNRVREFATIMVRELDQVKQQTVAQQGAIDRDFPNWVRRRSDYPDEHLRHEARREFFVTIVTLLESAQLSYVLLRDHLTADTWRSERLGEVSGDKRTSVLHEYAIMVKWFLCHGLFMTVEDTLRAIQRAAPDLFTVSRRSRSIAKVTSAILAASALQGYEDLFRLTRLTRNTIHTNGVHLPQDESSEEIRYAGEAFTFEYGQVLTWLNDQRAIWFVAQLTKAMEEIVRSPLVANVAYCPRTHV